MDKFKEQEQNQNEEKLKDTKEDCPNIWNNAYMANLLKSALKTLIVAVGYHFAIKYTPIADYKSTSYFAAVIVVLQGSNTVAELLHYSHYRAILKHEKRYHEIMEREKQLKEREKQLYNTEAANEEEQSRA